MRINSLNVHQKVSIGKFFLFQTTFDQKTVRNSIILELYAIIAMCRHHYLSSVLLLLCTGLSTHACANVYSPHWGIFSTKYLTINESAHKAHTLRRQNSIILTVTSILYICSYQKICRVILSTDNQTVFTIRSWCWEIGFV